MTHCSLKREDTAETPRIYVASLADYNAGRLHGRWIDANQSADSIRDEIAQMLTESEDPLLKITRYTTMNVSVIWSCLNMKALTKWLRQLFSSLSTALY